MDANEIVKAVVGVTKKWCRQRKAEERDQSRRDRRRAAMCPSYRVTQVDAAWAVMEKAYLHASSGGTLPAHARQIMYAARGHVQERTGEPLDDKYFTQTLLPDYMSSNSEQTARWDVVFDARGRFVEPHTGVGVPLGTLDVRQYVRGSRRDAPVRSRGLFPTRGPGDRFGAVLFIEKEGFLPLFYRVRLAERYDLAIMSTKGMSVVAARALVDSLCGGGGIPLLVLHDFDKSGFSIAGTLTRDTRRYLFTNRMKVIDLGLRLEDVQKQGLESESVRLNDTCGTRHNLESNGATGEEIAFLCAGQRVELNAFASRAFVNWVEAKLEKHGVKKVVPGDDVLAEAYRRSFVRQEVRRSRKQAAAAARERLAGSGVPADLRELVVAEIAADPGMPWDAAVAKVVKEASGR